jgi:outer membrane protein assembly factor BamA
MRSGVAQSAVLVTVSLFATKHTILAQQIVASPLRETQSDQYCPSLRAYNQQAPGPEISIAGVSFSGALQMAVVDQDQIADSVKNETHGTSLDGVTDEALERVRAEWLNRGYVKVQVNGEASTLTNTPATQRVALFVHVDEGPQYKLGRITFRKNRAISNVEALRHLFPIKDGDIFSREKIGKGLESLRKVYGQFGYINFTSIPDTTFDDENELISLDIDVDEGKQFLVSSLDVLGLTEPARQEIRKDFKVGQIFNGRAFELFLVKHSSLLHFSADDPRHVKKTLDERTGTVAITLDTRPCPIDSGT